MRVAAVAAKRHAAPGVWIDIGVDAHRHIRRDIPHVVVAVAHRVVGQPAVDGVVTAVHANGRDVRERGHIATQKALRRRRVGRRRRRRRRRLSRRRRVARRRMRKVERILLHDLRLPARHYQPSVGVKATRVKLREECAHGFECRARRHVDDVLGHHKRSRRVAALVRHTRHDASVSNLQHDVSGGAGQRDGGLLHASLVSYNRFRKAQTPVAASASASGGRWRRTRRWRWRWRRRRYHLRTRRRRRRLHCNLGLHDLRLRRDCRSAAEGRRRLLVEHGDIGCDVDDLAIHEEAAHARDHLRVLCVAGSLGRRVIRRASGHVNHFLNGQCD